MPYLRIGNNAKELNLYSMKTLKVNEVVNKVGKTSALNALSSVLTSVKGVNKAQRRKQLADFLTSCEIDSNQFKDFKQNAKALGLFGTAANCQLALRNLNAALSAKNKIELQKVNEQKDLMKQKSENLQGTQKETINKAKAIQVELRTNYNIVAEAVHSIDKHNLQYLCTKNFNFYALIGQLNAAEVVKYVRNMGKFDVTIVTKALYKVALNEVKGIRFTKDVQTTEGAKFVDFKKAIEDFTDLCQPFIDSYKSEANKTAITNANKLRSIDIENGVSYKKVAENQKTREAAFYNRGAFQLDINAQLAKVLNTLLPILRPSTTETQAKELLGLGVSTEVVAILQGRNAANELDAIAAAKAEAEAAKIEAAAKRNAKAKQKAEAAAKAEETV